MDLAGRIEQYSAKFPPALLRVLDAELAAGNRIIDTDFGRREDTGKLYLILDFPLRTDTTRQWEDVTYQEQAGTDRQICMFLSADEKFGLVAVKFKPMVLQPLPPGPPNPTEAAIARGLEREKREGAARLARQAAANAPPAQPAPLPPPKNAFERFVRSMTMTFDMWHDGEGYDLSALDECSPSELESLVTTLINRSPRDWRDIEALARIDSPRARAAVEAGLKDRDPNVRREAMRYAADKVDPKEREERLIAALRDTVFYGGLTQALDETETFHPPAVISELFRGALHREGEAAVHFAAMLFYLHGKSKEPFDWDHRPFFLEFHAPQGTERRQVFEQLCAKVGVDAAKYQ